MEQPFLTIAQATKFELIIKKSRFICALQRVETEEEAQAFIKTVQTANRKATHNCFAYLVGDHDQVQRESDNGEPSGTAGIPILESLQLAKLHNVVAVVTRYFGGIKLGAGGLIRAYSNVTTKAVHQAGIVQRVKQLRLQITVSYRQHDALVYYLKEQHLTLAGEEYGVNVTTNVFVNEGDATNIMTNLQNRFNDQLIIKKAGSHFHEVPYQP
ncbi:YigZ family protein [Limosilactobacillus panis]|uniref:YigZ family protein n=1 Tax=Limosilactobacillus panis TaxID=47493 RepID=A0ABT7VJU6_9LACO|nr:YigZ family protein [Limosilactobacillus panis]MDM8333007.1 YigZ family protein [Limosilactobacillus panis]